MTWFSRCVPEGANILIVILVLIILLLLFILIKVTRQKDKYLSDLFIANHNCAVMHTKFMQATNQLRELKREKNPTH